MWNPNLRSLLEQIIAGMTEAVPVYARDRELIRLLTLNAECHSHKGALELKIPMSSEEVDKVNNACRFLFEEFGFQLIPERDQVSHSVSGYPRIRDKVHTLIDQTRACPDQLKEAYLEHVHRLNQVEIRPLDCLFITAMPLEFLALARRFNSFTKGISPGYGRGFLHHDSSVGWVKGCVSDGSKTAKVMVACCSPDYGPVHANTAARVALSIATPRYVIIVGIGASLDDGTTFGLGDVGFSTELIDIHLGYDGTELSIETAFSTANPLDMNKVPVGLRAFIGGGGAGSYSYTGILAPKESESLRAACQCDADRNVITLLSDLTRSKAEKTDLKRKAKTLPGAGTASAVKHKEMVEASEAIRCRNNWITRIHLQRPASPAADPQAVPAKTLSGSRVVKQYGMRSYLKETFPEALLVEMEAAGVNAACSPNWMPFVVKSACDWADPRKEKSWQSYCADVAAAFAVDLALELSAK